VTLGIARYHSRARIPTIATGQAWVMYCAVDGKSVVASPLFSRNDISEIIIIITKRRRSTLIIRPNPLEAPPSFPECRG
jgi:hypothetical protein